MSHNIVPHQYIINRKGRNRLSGHPSFVLWFTGLSGSGKSTIANAVESELFHMGLMTYSLDGDNIRSGLNKDLGFSPDSRTENLRRVAELSRLFVDAGLIVLSTFISPAIEDRNMVKATIGSDDFVEVFVNTSLAECERRDVKGLYKKARQGLIKNFTGIDAPYEVPESPDILIQTEQESIEESVRKIVSFVQSKVEKFGHE